MSHQGVSDRSDAAMSMASRVAHVDAGQKASAPAITVLWLLSMWAFSYVSGRLQVHVHQCALCMPVSQRANLIWVGCFNVHVSLRACLPVSQFWDDKYADLLQAHFQIPHLVVVRVPICGLELLWLGNAFCNSHRHLSASGYWEHWHTDRAALSGLANGTYCTRMRKDRERDLCTA